jgi:hypothetical protein
MSALDKNKKVQIMTISELKEEYFVIQDLGYGEFTIDKFNNFDKAKELYDFNIKFEENLKKSYPQHEIISTMLIKGQILMETK